MEVSFGMKHEKTTWTYMMIWMTGAAQEMKEDSEKGMDDSENSSSTSGDSSGEALPYVG